MKRGRCIAIRGATHEARLACAMSIARFCSESCGMRVSYTGVWNRSGDPDPYNSYPFSGLTLTAPEAVLTYRRPGAGSECFTPDPDADLSIVDLPGCSSPAVVLDPASIDGKTLATWGFDESGLPRLDGIAPEVLRHIIFGGACTASCSMEERTPAPGLTLSVGGRKIPLSGYPERVLRDVVSALVRTLHGGAAEGGIALEITPEKEESERRR